MRLRKRKGVKERRRERSDDILKENDSEGRGRIRGVKRKGKWRLQGGGGREEKKKKL